MNENVLKVLRGFLSLNPADKAEFVKEFNQYQNLTYDFQKKNFEEQNETRIKALGPKNSVCKCCGR